jgi:hypothetical protein
MGAVAVVARTSPAGGRTQLNLPFADTDRDYSPLVGNKVIAE